MIKVRRQVYNQVWKQVNDQVNSQVYNQVYNQVMSLYYDVEDINEEVFVEISLKLQEIW